MSDTKDPGTYVRKCMVFNCKNKYFFPIVEPTYKNKSFFQFPVKDIERRHKWFKILNLEYTEKQCYLCQDHFNENQFSNTYKNRLLKFAIPSLRSTSQSFEIDSFVDNEPISIDFNNTQHLPPVNLPAINSHEATDPFQSPPLYQAREILELPSSSAETTNLKRKFKSDAKPCQSKTRSRKNFLADLGETRSKNLTPRKRKLYFINKSQNNTIYKLKHRLKNSNDKIKTAYEFSKTRIFRELEQHLDPAVVSFFQSSFANVSVKRHTWTLREKKFRLLTECQQCVENLLSDTVEPQHLFVSFKEYTDTKKRLTYVSKDVSYYLAKIHDCVISILPKYGYISHLRKKIKLILKSHLDFNWFSCAEHKDMIHNKLLDFSIELIIKKFYDDIYRNLKLEKQKALDEKKMRKIRHL
ncbi:uncharacterized protein LOC126733939 [Anthonomus grandis grandis]|uniref:uncharacterized protein LOC126733939 n=1 Tax=Anthonomus grandis grandis TaxID=2921223 RepID=UPI0021650F87|nr:uncharacterized protein LOC126733939 [Anthonomus grandis grandis]XP_050293384.1 uncharacterized protein LOC126733939 [Anthonomus grandis grandis]XP_050293385.1 uncharacterized protein LOC126733939 [Anthonomus grandis grandis]